MTLKQDQWRLENLRLPEGLVTEAKPAKPRRYVPKGRIKGEFTKGPIPNVWLAVAAELGFVALRYGLALWYLYGRSFGKQPITVSNVALPSYARSRDAKGDALKKLEAAGLIKVHREAGASTRSPRVTILCVNGETPEAIRPSSY